MSSKLFNGDVKTNIQTIAALVQIVLVPLLGWLIWSVQSHEVRLVRMESTRFTVQDGATLLSELRRIEREMSKLPPDEWRRRIRAMEHHLARTDQYESPK